MQLRRVRSRKWMEETLVGNGRGRRKGVENGLRRDEREQRKGMTCFSSCCWIDRTVDGKCTKIKKKRKRGGTRNRYCGGSKKRIKINRRD